MKLWTHPCLLLLIIITTGVTSAYTQVKAAFSSNTISGCAPLVVKFTDESAGNPTSWRWELGNGTISFLQNPATTYFNPGTYSVKQLIKKGNEVDSVIKVKYITVYASPVVGFSASETSGCFPKTVYFNDLSNPGDGVITKWEWDFGDGSSATGQHPQHIYEFGGSFNVSLRVHNSNGCIRTLTRSNYIKLSQGVQADFVAGLSNNCKPPSPIQFTNTSIGTGPLTFKWLFGDGTSSTDINPLHVYNSEGSFTVMLITKNATGCTDSITSANPVIIGNVKAAFTLPDLVCSGTPVTFVNESVPTPVSAQWEFGDNTFSTDVHPVKLYSVPGTYTVKLITGVGTCQDSKQQTITVLPKPVASFHATNTISCKPPFSTQFISNLPGNVQVTWYFGDGDSSQSESPVHAYKKQGEFDVTMIVRNSGGCQETIEKKKYIRVLPPIVSIINLRQEGCVPLHFTPEISVESPDSLIRYEWHFGDGSISSEPKPSKIYDVPGTYEIKLLYATISGCIDSLVVPQAIRVGKSPLSGFTANPKFGCAFQPIQFFDKSAGAPSDRWLWKFGDGGISEERNPVHKYSDTGFFDVTLIAWNSGCFDSIQIPRYIYINPPIAKFTDSSSCTSPGTRWFNDRSIGATGWLWKFGDGRESTEKSPLHIYQSGGSYEVSLTVTNDTCEHTFTKQVQVIAEKATFTASDSTVCKGTSARFDAVASSNIINYKWDFGDGIIENGSASTGHIYTQTGQFTVSLVTTDIYGCMDSIVRPFYMKVNGPTANFTASGKPVCTNTIIQFEDYSFSDDLKGIKQWTWDYGDGKKETLTAPPFQHLYQIGGNHAVSLTVTDETGCSHTSIRTALVLISQPKAVFYSPDTLSCTGKSIQIKNQSQGRSLSFQWIVSNGTNVSVPNPAIILDQEGDYNISLKVTDLYGCVDSLSRPAYIRIRNPNASFKMSDSVATCPPLVVNFTNNSTHYNKWEWDFGDGTRSSLVNPFHFYSYPGIYTARLIVRTFGGCSDTMNRMITVRGPKGTFSYDKPGGCEPTDIRFTGITKDDASFIWDFNDGTLDETADAKIMHNYSRRGAFVPKMILVDPQGCQVPIQSPDTIHIYGVDANFISPQKSVCDSGVISFSNKSESNDLIDSYKWNFGDGNSSTHHSPLYSYKMPGIYPVKLIITTITGCTDTIVSQVPVIISQTPVTDIRGDTAACTPALLLMEGLVIKKDTSSLKWRWDFGNNQTSANQFPNPVTYNQAGKYRVTMISANSFGCADTSFKMVEAYPLPATQAGMNKVICLGNSTELQATGAIKYQWTPAENLSCSDCATPKAAPTLQTEYVVTGKNQYGCLLKDSIIIGVQQPFKMGVSAADTLCVGESIPLFASGADEYKWSPATGLNNTQISSPLAKPLSSMIYRVIGTDRHQCFSDTGYIPVKVYQYPKVEAGPDQSMAVGSSLPLQPLISDDVWRIQWIPPTGLSCANCPTPVATPKENTTYSIEVVNQGGCLVKDQVTISVFCNNSNLFLPNTFSPNQDGNNDIFYPRGKGVYSIKLFRVFNRWGEMIFEGSNMQPNDPSKGWNGMHRSKPATQDVYVYSVEVICENKVVLKFKGNVVLIR